MVSLPLGEGREEIAIPPVVVVTTRKVGGGRRGVPMELQRRSNPCAAVAARGVRLDAGE
jgi:hypothetical protein